MLKVEKLTSRAGSFTLGPIDLEVKKGELFLIVGPSGAGKSTLLEVIAGLKNVISGEIILGGRKVTSLPPEERNLSMVFQKSLLFPHLSVFDNIAFGLKVKKLSEDKIRQRVMEVAELCQIEHLLKRKPAGLSGGEAQKVSLARALAGGPQVLLLDEPLRSLDRPTKEKLMHEIRRIKNKLEITAIYVTHDLEEACVLGDRLGIMLDGKLAQIGEPAHILRRPANEKIALLAGFDNIIRGKVISSGDRRLFASDGFLMDVSGEVPEGSVILAFRSDSAHIVEKREPAKSTFTFSGVVEEVWGWGEYRKATLRSGSTKVVLSLRNCGGSTPKQSSRIYVKLDPEKITFWKSDDETP